MRERKEREREGRSGWGIGRDGKRELGRGTAGDREIEGDRKELGREQEKREMETDSRKTTYLRSEKRFINL